MRYKNDEGAHSVEVIHAESLYEAVAEAIPEFREDNTISELPGVETKLTVGILPEPPEYQIKIRRAHEWAELWTIGGPAEMLRKERVRKMLTLVSRVTLGLTSVSTQSKVEECGLEKYFDSCALRAVKGSKASPRNWE